MFLHPAKCCSCKHDSRLPGWCIKKPPWDYLPRRPDRHFCMTPKIIVYIYNETAYIHRDQVPLTDSYLRYYVHTFYRTGRKPPYECRLPSAQMLLYFVLMTVTLKVSSPLKIKNGRTDILYLIEHQIEGQALPSISNISQVKRECKHFLK